MSNLFFYSHLLNRHIIPLASWTRRAIVPCLVLVVCLCLLTKSASAKQIFWFVEDLGDGTAAVVVETIDHGDNPDGFWFLIIHIETGHLFHRDFIAEGNPNPSDPDSGLMPDHEQILNELKKLGGDSLELDRDPLNNWLIQNLIDQGKVPGGAIDPWELGGFMMENPDVGGLPGGFDLGMPLGEIINQLKRSGSSGGSDNENLDYEVPPSYGTTGLEDFGPSIPWVNPIPIWMYYKTQELLNDR